MANVLTYNDRVLCKGETRDKGGSYKHFAFKGCKNGETLFLKDAIIVKISEKRKNIEKGN